VLTTQKRRVARRVLLPAVILIVQAFQPRPRITWTESPDPIRD